jgi:hypothetical protein
MDHAVKFRNHVFSFEIAPLIAPDGQITDTPVQPLPQK